MVVVAAVATTIIDRKLQQAAEKSDQPKADGKDGRPAHIIYGGRLYDVTASKLWRDGVHMARHFAGADLSEAMEKAPHGAEILERVKDIGPAETRLPAQTKSVIKLFVGLAYFVLFCVLIVLLCVAWWRWGPPLVDPFPRWTQENAAACLDCHNRLTPAAVVDWAESAHAINKVSCLHCHQASRSDPAGASDHRAYYVGQKGLKKVGVSAVVSPKDCSLCHLDRAKEFNRSKHAKTLQIVRKMDPWLQEDKIALVELITGCEACHGTGLADQTIANKIDGSVIQGIGRLNPDGSTGDCGACHGRHLFSTAYARRSEACGQCHVGPEHPQMAIYRESKHGAIYKAFGAQWNWGTAGSTWTAGVDYRTPTCAACHISGAGKMPGDHDVGHRLSWELQAPLAVHPAGIDWRAARRRREAVCLQCHSSAWTQSHFARLDRVVDEYNQVYFGPFKQVFEALYQKSVLDGNRLLDEPLEIELDEMWRREGRRVKMGAAMMAPDFTWWHGFYELKKRCTEILSNVQNGSKQITDNK
ncbi:MAG: multiheme c-type cytochrome [Desulfobacterales bacterium]|jgi:predicted heme/steroid binding protein